MTDTKQPDKTLIEKATDEILLRARVMGIKLATFHGSARENAEQFAIASIRQAQQPQPDAGEVDTRLAVAIDALHELARLGNGVVYGNSLGNDIAIKALRKIGAECQDEGCPHYAKPHSHSAPKISKE